MSNRKKGVSLLFKAVVVGGLVFGLFSSFASVEETLLIDDFESGEKENSLGGAADSWQIDPSDEDGKLKVSFEDGRRGFKLTQVLKLQYNITRSTFSGYYSKLQNIDARCYTGLRFYVRAGESGPDRFRVELKNAQGESGGYYVTDITQNWKKVEIPFKDFRGISNFRALEEILIMLEGSTVGKGKGTLYFDTFEFYADPKHFRARKEELEGKEKLSEEKLKEILNYSDEELLEYISRTTFNYFWENAHPETGFIRDRSRPDTPSSVAATGFGLAAVCIADERGWVDSEQARNRVLKTLESTRDKAEGYEGYFYHFIDMAGGQRAWNSELSSIDTALFLGGAITAGEYYGGEIKKIAEEIYKSVNWPFMMDPESKTIYMGWNPEDGSWKPEEGFKSYPRWDKYSEHTLMYLLGLGSPTYPLPEESWHSIERPVKEYEGLRYIYCEGESLFVYHFSHAFFDFRNKHDDYADYWINSRKATKANRLFAKSQAHRFLTYEKGFWGLSAGDGPDGYRAFGATHFTHNGTVAPYSVASSIPFIPEKAIDTVRRMIAEQGYEIWNPRYGFVSTFNLDRNWAATDHIAIDQGIMLLMIENYRSGFVWEYFMRNPYVQKAMDRAGFSPGAKEEPAKCLMEEEIFEYDIKTYDARKISSPSELASSDFASIDPGKSLEYGKVEGPQDLCAQFAMGYNDKKLFVIVDVTDDVLSTSQQANLLYEDDCIELFISPEGMLRWGDRKHFQIGFAPSGPEGEPLKYAFFQNEVPGEEVQLKSYIWDNGYKITAEISWDYLGITPEDGRNIGMSVAVHDRDYEFEDRGSKINWSFEEGSTGIMLGELILK